MTQIAPWNDPALPIWQYLGAQMAEQDGQPGVMFRVWAPGAQAVSVVGDFNNWDAETTPMTRVAGGVWQVFAAKVGDGALYKYRITGADGEVQPLKADPLGFGAQHTPETASIVRDLGGYGWDDEDWSERRAQINATDAPISIYEVHLGSWWRDATQNNRPISYSEAADGLVRYVADLGFTHIELLPIAEHPFDGSWGYQPVGLFAPTLRHGPPNEFRDLVKAAHAAGLGVILDWVPAHFPNDPHGLARFDGTALYEYADPREGKHAAWNTLVYDFGRPEVADFLIGNAQFWLQEYRVDGLRVDAVSSMLYRDFARAPDAWVPNAKGGRENFEAMALLRRLTAGIATTQPGTVTIAEESDGFPGVTRPGADAGLGFDLKWNMGWAFDTQAFFGLQPEARRAAYHKITFGLTYAFDEGFVLSVSHDEVVADKGSLLSRMPGDRTTQFANLRAFLAMMWGHPGKKLLFMGQEFGQIPAWDHAGQLDWAALDVPAHQGIRDLVRDLNRLYREVPSLHQRDCRADGFHWIMADAPDDLVYAWLRIGPDGTAPVAVVCNLSERSYDTYRIGLPQAGPWRVLLSTDAPVYGGTGPGTRAAITAVPHPMHGQPASADVTLPAFSVLYLQP